MLKIILATGDTDLNESLFSFLHRDFEVVALPTTRESCVAQLNHRPNIAIVAQRLPGQIDLVEMLYSMRLEETRIIFLASEVHTSDPMLKKFVDMGIYDLILGHVTIGNILEKINCPASFKEAMEILNPDTAIDIGVPCDSAGWHPWVLTKESQTGRIITTLSAGGTGKTMFAVNLAAMLAEKGSSVALVDLDTKKLAVHTWLNCPQGDAALFELFTSFKAKEDVGDLLNFFFRPVEVNGLWVLTADPAKSGSAFKEKHLLDLLKRISEEVNYLVVDTGSDWDIQITKTVTERAFANFFITTQDFHHLNAAVNYLVNIDPPRCFLVLNRFVQTPMLSKNDVEQTLARPVDFTLPDLTSVIFESIKGGVPAIILDPDLKKVFREICSVIFYEERRKH